MDIPIKRPSDDTLGKMVAVTVIVLVIFGIGWLVYHFERGEADNRAMREARHAERVAKIIQSCTFMGGVPILTARRPAYCLCVSSCSVNAMSMS